MRLRRIRRLRALAALARMEGISRRGNSISFARHRYYLQLPPREYTYYLRAREPAWVPVRQIEAGRRAIERYLRHRGKLWVLPHKPLAIKNTETRIDRSYTGDPKYVVRKYWVCLIQPNEVLYEMSEVPETIARIALARAAYGIPIKTEVLACTLPSKNLYRTGLSLSYNSSGL